MKAKYYIILLTSLVFAACGNRSATHNHDHDGHNHAGVEAHDEEAHDHAEGSSCEDDHNHEGHDHEHEGHDHEHEGESDAEKEAADPDIVVFTPERAERAGVRVERIEAAPIGETISTFGRITAASGDAATLAAPTAGIVSFAVQPVVGMQVSKGETIAVVSSSGIADGDPIVKAKIAFEAAEKEYDRAKKLVAKKIVSAREFEAAEERYLTAKAAYEGVAVSGNGAAGSAVNAPSNGYIVSVGAAEGSFAAVGDPIVRIAEGRKMLLEADIPQSRLRSMGNIADARFRLSSGEEAYSISTLGGKRVSVGRSVEAGSYYLPVTFAFENTVGAIDGETVEIWLEGTAKRNAVAVPRSALTEEQGLFFVYVRLDEDCYRKTPVKTGAAHGSEIEITSGLQGGEEVVVEGAYHVKLASVKTAIPGHTHNH